MAVERPCELRLQIEDGDIVNLESMGFHLMESTNVVVPPQRDYETEDFPENDGVKVYKRVAYKSFDYTVKLLYMGDLDGLNEAIRAFWNSMFSGAGFGDDTRVPYNITLYNDYKAVAMVGIAKSISDMEQIIEVRKGCYILEFTMLVPEPKKCIWDTTAIVLRGNIKSSVTLFPTASRHSGNSIGVNNTNYTSSNANQPAANGFPSLFQRFTPSSTGGDNSTISVYNTNLIHDPIVTPYNKVDVEFLYRSNQRLATTHTTGRQVILPVNTSSPRKSIFKFRYPGTPVSHTFSILSNLITPNPLPMDKWLEIAVNNIYMIFDVTVKLDGVVIATGETDTYGNISFTHSLTKEEYDAVSSIEIEITDGVTTRTQTLVRLPYNDAIRDGFDFSATI